MKRKNIWKILTAVTAVLTLLLGVAIPVTGYYATMINAALGAETQQIIPGENSQIFYWTEFETEEELVANDMAVCRALEAEGVRLKSEVAGKISAEQVNGYVQENGMYPVNSNQIYYIEATPEDQVIIPPEEESWWDKTWGAIVDFFS